MVAVMAKYPYHFLTNFEIGQRPLYEEAIKETGYNEIYIGEAYFPIDISPEDGLCGLYCTSRGRGFSPFWQYIRRREEQQ
jgi:hypothetical protein